MAYSDPQTVTINAIANVLPRTSSGTNSGAFTKDDGTVKLTVSHQYGKRNRRMVRLDHSKIATDPFVGTQNQKYTVSVYLVADLPPAGGYTLTEQKQIVDSLVAYLTASSGARVTQLLGGEN